MSDVGILGGLTQKVGVRNKEANKILESPQPMLAVTVFYTYMFSLLMQRTQTPPFSRAFMCETPGRPLGYFWEQNGCAEKVDPVSTLTFCPARVVV